MASARWCESRARLASPERLVDDAHVPEHPPDLPALRAVQLLPQRERLLVGLERVLGLPFGEEHAPHALFEAREPFVVAPGPEPRDRPLRLIVEERDEIVLRLAHPGDVDQLRVEVDA